MGLFLTAERASMKIPGNDTHNPTPIPSTKISPIEYKYQVSFIHFLIPSFIHPINIYHVLNTALNIRRTKISKTVSVLKKLTAQQVAKRDKQMNAKSVPGMYSLVN